MLTGRVPIAAAAAALLVALARPAAARAQDASARVTVVVRAGDAPVSEAEVRASGVVALTNEAGSATLRLRAGGHRVVVRRIGYERASLRLSLRAGADTTVTVSLEPEAVEVEGLVVTATRSERPVEEEPIRVEALPREEIDENVALAPGNLTMVLTDLGGVRIQTTAPSLGGAQVRLLGLRGRYTQLLTDGLPLYGGTTGSFSLLQIPPMDLAQVEVIKGTASALYGASALGGVVNLVSRRPAGEPEVLVNQTSRDATDAVAFVPARLGPSWGLTLLAGAHRQGMQDVDGDGWSDLSEYRRAVVRPRLFWDLAAGSSLFATAGGTIEEREGGTVAGAVAPDGAPYREARDTRRADAGLAGRFLLRTGHVLAVRAAGQVAERENAFGTEAYDDRQTTWFAEATVSGVAGVHHWLVGAAYQEDRYRSADLAPLEYRYRTPALFAHDVWTPSERLTLSASARADAHELGTFVSPRLSALWKPGLWAARASFGLGFAAPTPFVERTEEIGLSRLDPLGDLDAERARSASLDLERDVGAWHWTASFFGTEIEDALVLRESEVDPGRVELANATTPTRAYGLEARGLYHVGNFYILGSYTYLRSREEAPDGSRQETPLTPRNVFMVDAVWEPEEVTRIGLEGAYHGRQPLEPDDPYRARSRPYVLLGVLAERRFGPVRAFFNLENILDVRQTEWAPLVRPARAPDGRWTTDVWAPLEGRTLNGGLRLKL